MSEPPIHQTTDDVLERIVLYIRHQPIPTPEALELLDHAADEIEKLRTALTNINRRASPGSDRTFDDCSRDLYWCACEARRVLNV